uniref:Peptidase M13 N-terminal domain-containing protein n=1 Tax=Photinus pyralis TaxID=7054 RepID=A0A1Y1N0P2_PHOPY
MNLFETLASIKMESRHTLTQRRRTGCRLRRHNRWVRALCLLFLVPQSAYGHEGNRHERCLTTNKEAVCLTPACIHSASTIIYNMNASVDPCEDFYNFACGGFVARMTIPDDYATVSPFTITQEKLLTQLRAVLEEPVSPTEPNAYKILKKYYALCMDTATIDKNVLSVMTGMLSSFGGWPVLENDWMAENFDWKETMYRFRKAGMPAFSIVYIFPGTNTYNTSQNIINCDQAKLSLDRRHLVNGFDDKFVQYYYQYLVDLAVMLGANKTTAVKEMEESVKFEVELAKITLATEDRRNATALTNIMTLAEAQDRFPVIPWVEYLENMIDDPSINITLAEEVDIGVPNFLTDLDGLLKLTSKRTLANYIMSQFVYTMVPFTSTQMRSRRLKYIQHFKGTSQMNPRWRECTEQASKELPIASGSLYVQKYFSDEAKRGAETMVNYLKDEFLHMLQTSKWMDDATRKKAVKKALKMSSQIGYPEEYLDDAKIDGVYENLNVDTNDYLTLTLNIERVISDKSYKELRMLMNKTDWTQQSSVTVVNAYYNPTENGIELPAGILQGVFFDHQRPNYLNFGSIGFAIGHEITHGFDDMGRQYDENGALSDWWEEHTANQFLKHAQCIIDQFNNYTSPITNQQINGINTQGENIADNGGIRKAYLAYQNWVKDKGVEPKLPGLQYTPEQLFWISMANTWCVKEREEYLIQEILTDSHPPSDIRVLGLVSNSEYFSKDFHCKSNSKMNPAHKCQVW